MIESDTLPKPAGLSWSLQVLRARLGYMFDRIRFFLQHPAAYMNADKMNLELKTEFLETLRERQYPDLWWDAFLRFHQNLIELSEMRSMPLWWEYYQRARLTLRWRSYWHIHQIGAASREGRLNMALLWIAESLKVRLDDRVDELLAGPGEGEVIETWLSKLNCRLVERIEDRRRTIYGDRHYEERVLPLRQSARPIDTIRYPAPIEGEVDTVLLDTIWSMPIHALAANLLDKWDTVTLGEYAQNAW